MKTNRFQNVVNFLSIVLLGTSTLSAQINYNGGTYIQDFNGLPLSNDSTQDVFELVTGRGPHAFNDLVNLTPTGMDGWYFGNPGGSSSNTEFRAHNGSRAGNSGRGVISFGTDSDIDRALGALPTGNQISHFGFLLTNNTGQTLEQMTISFTGEQWRKGNTVDVNYLNFEWGYGAALDDGIFVTDLDLRFSRVNNLGSEVPLNGNDPVNQQFFSKTITGIGWLPGDMLILRWTAVDFAGQDDGLAIDNFSFSAAIPEPSTSVVLALLIGVCGLTHRNRRRCN
ncbi:MAG TPA: hypothetical protein PKD64_16545 [Pirellulaceae bacterium]|nr:hypothetical protein [Pirellulaceae bacterium]HMO93800.1 hypothetical protein [Pirellulaceae bacterium]HMP70606.1 hypothetical protein [Pirellulaceae bacterium]